MADNAQRKVLDMVEQGQISAEEGLRLINAMGSNRISTPDQVESLADGADAVAISPDDVEESSRPYISEEEMQRMKRLQQWRVLPFGIGLLITTLGAIWMYSGYEANGFGWGFWLAWIPFLLGIFVIAVSFQTSRSLWLHVRIRQKPGESPQRISISLPMPTLLTRWFLTTIGTRIPGFKDQPLDDYSEMLENLSPETPFYVHVNEDNGEEVEVFIG